MNADNKRLIKQFVMQRLWGDSPELNDLRTKLSAYSIRNNINEFEAMEEYEYQVERIEKMLACF